MENTIYPVTAQDRMNYLLGLFSANQIISIALNFPQKLDTDILERAFQVTLKMYPVLACCFIEDEEPYWERDNNSINSIFSYEDCNGSEIDVKVMQYIAQPRQQMNAQIQSKLFRANTDILCVKISHLCSDAAGLKEYMTTLSSIYTKFCQSADFNTTESEILAGNNTGFRDQAPLFYALGITDIKSAIKQNNTGPMWTFPSDVEKNDTPGYIIRRLPPNQMKHLIVRSKEHGATVNEALIAAYFRALEKQAVLADAHVKDRMIGITVDLRRHLPDQTTGTVCNLSSMETPIVELHEDDAFETTLVKVKKAMETIKSSQPGLSSAAGMELFSKMPLSRVKGIYSKQHEIALKTKMALPLLTNIGVMNHRGFQFDNVEASDGYMITPIMMSPFFCVGASTYKDTLTLSVGFHTPAVLKKTVTQLLDDMTRELLFD